MSRSAELRQVLEDLRAPDVEVRLGAIVGLERLGPAVCDTAGELVEALSEPDPVLRDRLLEILVGMGPRAVPALLTGLNHPSARVRAWSAYGLGEIGPDAREAVMPLLRCLRDNSPADPSPDGLPGRQRGRRPAAGRPRPAAARPGGAGRRPRPHSAAG